MELLIIDGETETRRSTDIGCDLLTLLPTETQEPPAIAHERKQRGLAYAWKPRPNGAQRKRIAQQSEPVSVIVQAQRDEYCEQPANLFQARRGAETVLWWAENLPIAGTRDPLPGDLMRYCHERKAHYVSAIERTGDGDMRLCLRVLARAHAAAAAVLWDRLLTVAGVTR